MLLEEYFKLIKHHNWNMQQLKPNIESWFVMLLKIINLRKNSRECFQAVFGSDTQVLEEFRGCVVDHVSYCVVAIFEEQTFGNFLFYDSQWNVIQILGQKI